MNRSRWFPAISVLAVMLTSRVCAAQAEDAKLPASFPQAQEWLKKMSDYMATLNSFRVHVDTTRELIFPKGGVIYDDAYGDILVERPNMLRIDMVKPNRSRQIYSTLGTLTVYTPKQNVYGTIPVPPTFDEMIPAIRSEYGIDLPLADLLRSDIYDTVMPNVDTGIVVGPSVLNGVYCRHLAFRSGQKEWQIWIEYSDTPVPRRIAVIDKSVKGNPRFMATLTKWEMNPTFEPGTFTFTPPTGAQEIKFIKPQQVPAESASGGE